ncbi:response regulator [Demetria terragena]|uniref:response regulator n=1 Tax=Demetria terragena TaxID=63959 RepID=UPI0003764AD7|nr:response regulator [Demetria terragena]
MTSDDLRVLIVDDDTWIAALHQKFVEQAGGCVVVGLAHLGADALRLAIDEQPDLVLLDIHLPDRSGLEVLRQMRSAGVAADVLMVTADREAEAVQLARASGATGYLVKPFTQDELHERLREVRRARKRLLGLSAAAQPQQADIDRVFGVASHQPVPALPNGLNRTTADLVLKAIDEGELSATECATTLGLARVTARRYLEYFVDSGMAVARQQYGKVGRPQRYYTRA